MAGPVYGSDGNGVPGFTSRFEMACKELLRSVQALQADQTFSVVFFNSAATIQPEFVQCHATPENRQKLADWLARLFPDGGTDPIPAIKEVMSKKAFGEVDVVFLLSDGEFEPSAVRDVRHLNRRQAIINTISIEMEAATLKQIAGENAGQHIRVK